MNKKILMVVAFLALLPSLSLSAAACAAPDAIQIGTYTVNGNFLLITPPDFAHTLRINLTQKLFGEEDKEGSIGTAMIETHRKGFDFCFTVCNTAPNTYSILRTDKNLYPLVNPPCEYTRTTSYIIPVPNAVTGQNLQIFSTKFLTENQLPIDFTPLHPSRLMAPPRPSVVYVQVPVFPSHIIVNGTPLFLQPQSSPFRTAVSAPTKLISSQALTRPISAPTQPQETLSAPMFTSLQTRELQSIVASMGQQQKIETEQATHAALLQKISPLSESPDEALDIDRSTQRLGSQSLPLKVKRILKTGEPDLENPVSDNASTSPLALQAIADEEEADLMAGKKKAAEDAKIRRVEQEKAAQEARILEQEKRHEQAERDKALAAATRAEADRQKEEQKTEAEQKARAQKEQTSSAAKAAASLTTSAQTKKDKSKQAATDDDAFLEAARKEAETAKALLAQQPAAAAMEKRDQTSAAEDAPTTVNPMQEKRNLLTLQLIASMIKSAHYTKAKKLLPNISESHPYEYWNLLMDIYTKESGSFLQEEINTLMDNAKRLVEKKAKTPRHLKCILYFGLALHAQTYEEKETYLDLCLQCGEHVRAATYWERIKLEHHASLNLQCAKGANCLHAQMLNFVTKQRESHGTVFADAIVMLLKLYSSHCPQIKALVPAPERTKYIKNVYTKTVMQGVYTQAELDEIHSLIPETIIPLDQRVQALQ